LLSLTDGQFGLFLGEQSLHRLGCSYPALVSWLCSRQLGPTFLDRNTPQGSLAGHASCRGSEKTFRHPRFDIRAITSFGKLSYGFLEQASQLLWL
jgi:hypothetical protein